MYKLIKIGTYYQYNLINKGELIKMSEHPIEGLMLTAMNSIQDMVDVNTIIGEPIETSNNMIIIPISKVGFGFAAGGSEFKGETIDEYTKREKEEQVQYRLPFGGGAGAGVSISPVAFLVVSPNNVKLLPVCHSSAVDKLIDYVPDLMEKVNCYLNKSMQNKKEEKKEQAKRLDREHRETKESIDNLTETIQNVNRIRPRRSRMGHSQPVNNNPMPAETTDYEYEYDETEDKNDFEEE